MILSTGWRSDRRLLLSDRLHRVFGLAIDHVRTLTGPAGAKVSIVRAGYVTRKGIMNSVGDDTASVWYLKYRLQVRAPWLHLICVAPRNRNPQRMNS